jgi:hypothetical protein
MCCGFFERNKNKPVSFLVHGQFHALETVHVAGRPLYTRRYDSAATVATFL